MTVYEEKELELRIKEEERKERHMELKDAEVELSIRQKTADMEFRKIEHQALSASLQNVNQCLEKVNRAVDHYINRSELQVEHSSDF